MAKREIERWITVNGVHVPVYKGQSSGQAVKEHMTNMALKKADESKKGANKAQAEQIDKNTKIVLDSINSKDDREYESLAKDVDKQQEQIAKNKEQADKANGKINNTFKSEYGFKNVGEVKVKNTMWGISAVGTVEPTADAVQEYLDKPFKNSGKSYKKDIIKKIVRDMNGRGYIANVSEDGNYITNTDSSIVIGISKNKLDEWKAKLARSSGTKSRGGMKGVLDKYH